MMNTLQSDMRKLQQSLTEFQKKQLPFATSVALNQVASLGQKAALRSMSRNLDKPTPFTKRGLRITRSTKTRLMSEVYIQEIQAAYLQYQVEGGTRRPKSRALIVPVQQRVNQYGNLPRNKVKQLLARNDVFVVHSRNRDGRSRELSSGIYQRMKTGRLKMLVAFETKAKYSKRYPFEASVVDEVNRYLVPVFRQSFARALATAR